jgi:hypothetical protein
VPLDIARQQVGFLSQLLGIVLAEVPLPRALVDSEDVGGRFELRHGDEADLKTASQLLLLVLVCLFVFMGAFSSCT